eukprot:TRINITY_DN3378_c0_g2_i1.p2 TRINITY_DN3378_c0_g2~~TRINITY_DN3378_c0_g2_i1.p2  ORF type:complete len:572 (-),score=238.15 TRINITY_DN3378_c0_g2_i1:5555-7270(-)
MLLLGYLFTFLFNLLFYLFIFVCGGAFFLFVASYLILGRLSGLVNETTKEYVDLSVKAAINFHSLMKTKREKEEEEENARAEAAAKLAAYSALNISPVVSDKQQSNSEKRKSSVGNQNSSTPSSPPTSSDSPSKPKYIPQTWFKLRSRPPLDKEEEKKLSKEEKKANEEDSKVWNWAVLKNNMLFHFSDNKATTCIRPVCLDGCSVSTGQVKKNGRPLWRDKNWIVLSHSSRDIIPDKKTVYLHFQTAKDLEEWYLLLQKATNMNRDLTDAEKHQHEFWGPMSERLTNHSADMNPHWITAIFCRLLWRIHDSKGFTEFLMEKFQKKLNKIEKPSIVKDLRIKDVYFGPELPVVNKVKLLSVSEMGDIELDADFVYHGGFHLSIEAVFEIPLAIKKFTFPAILSVEIKRIAGQAHIHVNAPPSPRFWLGFYGEPVVEVEVKTELGEHKYKVANLPTLANIIIHKVKSEILQTMILPHLDDWPIPKIDENDKLKIGNASLDLNELHTHSPPHQSPPTPNKSLRAETSQQLDESVDNYIGYHSPDLVQNRGRTKSKGPNEAVELQDFSGKSKKA